jgi:predicted DNA-binding transcriptional regulator AlpA
VAKDILAGAELLGLAELADLLGLSRPRTSELVRLNREDFPRPVVVLACGPIWLHSDVADWLGSGDSLGLHLPDREGGIARERALARPAPPQAERGWVYVLCFGTPRRVPDGDVGHPVSHYVGWTQQVPPWRRVTSHGGARFLVSINPGTPADEERLKATGSCAVCGSPLEYRHPRVGPPGGPHGATMQLSVEPRGT